MKNVSRFSSGKQWTSWSNGKGKHIDFPVEMQYVPFLKMCLQGTQHHDVRVIGCPMLPSGICWFMMSNASHWKIDVRLRLSNSMNKAFASMSPCFEGDVLRTPIQKETHKGNNIDQREFVVFLIIMIMIMITILIMIMMIVLVTIVKTGTLRWGGQPVWSRTSKTATTTMKSSQFQAYRK